MNILGLLSAHIPVEIVLPVTLWAGSWLWQTARAAYGLNYYMKVPSTSPGLKSFFSAVCNLSRWKREMMSSQWPAQFGAATLTVVVVVVYVSFVESRLKPLKDVRSAILNKVPYCSATSKTDSCNQLVDEILANVTAATKGLSGTFELLLVSGTLVTIVALLLCPHVMWRLSRSTKPVAKDGLAVYLSRTHLTTFLELVLAPPLVWLLFHKGAAVTDGGYSVAEIASAVLSPLTLDVDQHLRTLGPLVPALRRDELFLAAGLVKNALYVIAALNALILLVVFEIAKSMVIKPLLDRGLDAFRWPCLSAPESNEKDVKTPPSPEFAPPVSNLAPEIKIGTAARALDEAKPGIGEQIATTNFIGPPTAGELNQKAGSTGKHPLP
ncbi:hypothetical protein PQR08_35160 [Caballeronia jiangsuensis]|uniref:Uncharacterized protein n=1 Tax=Caballeronia jiangsuensis TaxID=1458357 RepID=A0ABW9CY03_9BURK